MPRKPFDKDKALKGILGVTRTEEMAPSAPIALNTDFNPPAAVAIESTISASVPVTQLEPAQDDQANGAVVAPIASSMPPSIKPRVKKNQEEKKLGRFFYLSDELYKAIQLRVLFKKSSQDKDQSAVVCAALETYLAKELNELRQMNRPQ